MTPQDFILGPQIPLANNWFDTNQIVKAKVHGEACPTTPPTDPNALNSFILLHYYDLALTEYIAHKRSGDPIFLAYARKCADSWWKHPSWIKEGAQRDFENGQGPAPRHAGLGGLMLRALDGRPEFWDWIVAYTKYHFNLWLKSRVNNPELYYGVREGAFMLHYGTWLAKALPDSFPNAAQIRAEFLADVETVSINYFGRLQQTDGSWRWNDYDYTDADGGTLQGITQPFMVGLLLNALIDVHQLTIDQTVKESIKNQITKSCRHLYTLGPYRKDDPVPGLTGVRWRSFWYFYHGGTTVNPTKYQNGGGSYTDISEGSWVVSNERQAISTIFSAYGYAYQLTGDSFFKTAGDELFDAAFGGGDGYRNFAEADAKGYNQNYRRGASYKPWLTNVSTPTPTPTPEPIPIPIPPAPTVRKVAFPSGEAKQNEVVAQQWSQRYRFKRHLSGNYAEFELVL